METKEHPLKGQVRKLCGKCNSCGCDGCFESGNCRVCKTDADKRYEEKHSGKAWVKA